MVISILNLAFACVLFTSQDVGAGIVIMEVVVTLVNPSTITKRAAGDAAISTISSLGFRSWRLEYHYA
jgi:hypothetical protein